MSIDSEVGSGLERLISAHDAIGSPLRSYLRPGRDVVELDAMLGGFGLPVRSVLLGLWDRYDGIDQLRWQDTGRGALCLFTTSVWLSSEEAASQYEWLFANRASIIPSADPDEVWNESWFPIFQLNGSYLAVDTRTAGGEVWVVHFEEVPADPTRRISRSLNGFLDGTTAQFEAGEYVWSPQLDQLQAADGLLVDLFEEAEGVL